MQFTLSSTFLCSKPAHLIRYLTTLSYLHLQWKSMRKRNLRFWIYLILRLINSENVNYSIWCIGQSMKALIRNLVRFWQMKFTLQKLLLTFTLSIWINLNFLFSSFYFCIFCIFFLIFPLLSSLSTFLFPSLFLFFSFILFIYFLLCFFFQISHFTLIFRLLNLSNSI